MTAIDSSTLQGVTSSTKAATAKIQTLSQDDFLRLMTAQLKAQDPLKPLQNSEFVSQMAQFSTVSGIQNLQDSFSKLAASLSSNDLLQAANVVGHDVLVPASQIFLPASGSVLAGVDVPASGNVVVEVSDSSGQVLRRIDVGSQSAGLVALNWDGLDNTGARLAEGSYRLNARVVNGQETQAATTYASGHVNSVSSDSNGGLNVNVQGLGTIALSMIRQIL